MTTADQYKELLDVERHLNDILHAEITDLRIVISGLRREVAILRGQIFPLESITMADNDDARSAEVREKQEMIRQLKAENKRIQESIDKLQEEIWRLVTERK